MINKVCLQVHRYIYKTEKQKKNKRGSVKPCTHTSIDHDSLR